MVQIVLDHTVISDINGKLGGGYFKRAGCGMHYQQNPRKRGKGSIYQVTQNSFFRTVKNAWTNENFQGGKPERDSWYRYARDHPVKNKKGETKILTPQTMFYKFNIVRVIEGQPILYMAPQADVTEPPPRLVWPTTTGTRNIAGEAVVVLRFPQEMKKASGSVMRDVRLHRIIVNLWDPFPNDQQQSPYYLEWISDTEVAIYFTMDNNKPRWYLEYRREQSAFNTAENRSYGSFRVIVDIVQIP